MNQSRLLAKELKSKLNNMNNNYEGARSPELDKLKEQIEKTENVANTDSLLKQAQELSKSIDAYVPDVYNNNTKKK